MKTYTIENIQPYIIFSAITGSKAYGTQLPTSDTDIRGVFIQPLDDILGYGKVDQVSDDTNDTTYYEIGRFLELLQTTNPNICELLNTPEDCILFKDPIFDLILEHKNLFITKRAKDSFGGYAVTQIRKARGLNKKMNWEDSDMKRKTVLDFCYILLPNGGSESFKDWLYDYNDSYTYAYNSEERERTYEDFGLACIDHARDTYNMYDLFYYINKGIISDLEKSNDIQLTSIPKGIPPCGILVFNKDGYSSHCKKYKEYQEWLIKRNEDRVKMNKDHGKNYDSKNMMHCIRLLNMSNEIAEGKGINVRRSDGEIKKLLSIRKGEYEYDDILKEAESLIEQMNIKFEKCNLPKDVDETFVNELLKKIRKIKYDLK